MIFGSKNEQGVPAYELVASGIKRVTRRLKPKRVGSVIAVQPARATKSVCTCGHLYSEHSTFRFDKNYYPRCCDECNECMCYEPLRVRVVSCEKHKDWFKRMERLPFNEGEGCLTKEARHEGFNSWAGLLAWFEEHGIDINATYRIQFERVNLEHIALNSTQIKKMGLPSAPAKLSDSRSKNWGGDGVVELDAVEPKKLERMAEKAIKAHFDEGLFDELNEAEEEEREKYRKALKSFVRRL